MTSALLMGVSTGTAALGDNSVLSAEEWREVCVQEPNNATWRYNPTETPVCVRTGTEREHSRKHCDGKDLEMTSTCQFTWLVTGVALCQVLSQELRMHALPIPSSQGPIVGVVFIPLLLCSKPKLWELKGLAQSHAARRWPSQDLQAGSDSRVQT